MFKAITLGSASTLALLASAPFGAAEAASVDSRIQALQHQIELQQQQLQQQQQLLTSLMTSEAQTKETVTKVAATKAARPSATAVMSRQNRPGWRSADGQTEIDLGALLQIDGGVSSYRPGNPSATFRKLQSGINARRAQIQVSGRFAGDWEFGLQYDMGGSNEQFGGSAGGITSGLKNALLSYTGFKPWGTHTAIDFGYTTPPIDLDSSPGSSNYLFIEHPTPSRLLENFSGGPGRGVFAFRDYTNRFFGYVALSGPKTGDIHDSTEGAAPIFAIGRAAYKVVDEPNLKLQLGGQFQRLIQPSAKGISLADEAEARVDPTTFIGISVPGTGTNPLQGGGTYAAEVAGQWGRFFTTASWIHYDFERKGLAENDMWGAYGDVMYTITGEKRPYRPATGGWGGITPAHPFSLKDGGWGAWEVGVRYSYVDLNSNLGTASAIQGGHASDLAMGVNWYVSDNVKFQANWIHGFQGGLLGATGSATNQEGTKLTVGNGRWDEVVVRSQFSF